MSDAWDHCEGEFWLTSPYASHDNENDTVSSWYDFRDAWDLSSAPVIASSMLRKKRRSAVPWKVRYDSREGSGRHAADGSPQRQKTAVLNFR
jgi:hypothetical protein